MPHWYGLLSGGGTQPGPLYQAKETSKWRWWCELEDFWNRGGVITKCRQPQPVVRLEDRLREATARAEQAKQEAKARAA